MSVVLPVLICGPAIAQTPLTTLRHQTRELLKEDASLDDDAQAKDAMISSLCDLYVILRSDSRYPISEMLRGDATKLRRRLISIAAMGGNPWDLVELIQRVIAPDFWDARGGSGTIQYFAMRRVLVVRATTDVHEQIRDLLMALR